MTAQLPLLTSQQVLDNMPDPLRAVELMRDGLIAIADGSASTTPKAQVKSGFADTKSANNAGSAMPAAWPDRNLLGIKWLAITPSNATDKEANPNGLPTIDGVMVLNDARDGHIRAIMPAAELTGLRTAAVTGASLAIDADNAEGTFDAAKLRPITFLGTGVQARSHAQVLSAMGIEKLTVWGRREEALEELKQWAAENTPDLELVTTTDRTESLKGAGIIISGVAMYQPGLLFDPAEIADDATLLPLDYGTMVGADLVKKGLLVSDDADQFKGLMPKKFPKEYPAPEGYTGELLTKPRPDGLVIAQNLGSGLNDLLIADEIVSSLGY